MNQAGKTKWVDVFEATPDVATPRDGSQVIVRRFGPCSRHCWLHLDMKVFRVATSTTLFQGLLKMSWREKHTVRPSNGLCEGKGAGTGTAAYNTPEEVAAAIATLNGQGPRRGSSVGWINRGWWNDMLPGPQTRSEFVFWGPGGCLSVRKQFANMMKERSVVSSWRQLCSNR